ncbi:MAG: beta-lactamase family protein [Clostridia bacterium]|nr:beta-lactamase family protein [Clostridia bacterium]
MSASLAKRALSLLTALLLLLPGFALAEDAENSGLLPQDDLGTDFAEDLEAWAEQRFRTRRAVNGCVVLTRGNEVIFSCAYGTTRKNGDVPVTIDTAYRIASVTKCVTALGIMCLWEDGLVDLDADVSQYTGFPVRNPAFPDDAITLRQLLTHTSSIKRNVNQYVYDWDLISMSRDPIFDHDIRPGTAYAYSNLNGALLGAAIEGVTGKSLNTFMTERVFSPLGLAAAYHHYLLPRYVNAAVLLAANGSPYLRVKDEINTFFTEYNDEPDPAGNCGNSVGRVFMSAEGLSRILRMLLHYGEWQGQDVLHAGTVMMMERDQSTVTHSSVKCFSPYGLGMERVEGLPGGTWYGHQGRYAGQTVDAYFQPSTDLCLVVICNGCGYSMEGSLVHLCVQWMERAQAFAADVPEESFEVVEE